MLSPSKMSDNELNDLVMYEISRYSKAMVEFREMKLKPKKGRKASSRKIKTGRGPTKAQKLAQAAVAEILKERKEK